MKTESALRVEAMNALIQTLGAVDAERFISIIKRDAFDYTEWRRKLWEGMTIEEIYAEAATSGPADNRLRYPNTFSAYLTPPMASFE